MQEVMLVTAFAICFYVMIEIASCVIMMWMIENDCNDNEPCNTASKNNIPVPYDLPFTRIDGFLCLDYNEEDYYSEWVK